MLHPEWLRGTTIDGDAFLLARAGSGNPEITRAFRGLRHAFVSAEAGLGTRMIEHFDGLAWRRHLVGMVSALARLRWAFGPPSPALLEAAWTAVERGSWAGPQLLAMPCAPLKLVRAVSR